MQERYIEIKKLGPCLLPVASHASGLLVEIVARLRRAETKLAQREFEVSDLQEREASCAELTIKKQNEIKEAELRKKKYAYLRRIFKHDSYIIFS